MELRYNHKDGMFASSVFGNKKTSSSNKNYRGIMKCFKLGFVAHYLTVRLTALLFIVIEYCF